MNCSVTSWCLLSDCQVDLRILVSLIIHFVVGGQFVSYLIHRLTDQLHGLRWEFFHAVHIHGLVGVGRTGFLMRAPVMPNPLAQFWSCSCSLRFWRLFLIDCLLSIL